MTAAVTIRPATPDDAGTLVEFNAAMALETEQLALDRARLARGVEALLADPERGRYFVLEETGRPTAALMLTREWSDWRNGFFWWIQSVYVRPDQRRHGHYRRLHAHVRKLALRAGNVCGIRLYVEHENHGARATYQALGMQEAAYRIYEELLSSGR